MPSKRQPSKQRRAAQNRNTRAQRAARAERAGELAASAPASGGGASADSSGKAGGEARPRPPGLLSSLFGGGGGGGGGLSGLFGGGGGRASDGGSHESDAAPRPAGLLSGLFGGGGGGAGGAKGGRGGERPAPAARPRPQPMEESGRGIIATKPDGTRVPGAMAAFLAVVLAGLACVMLLVTPTIEVDDRGERIVNTDQGAGFEGLYLEARGLEVNGEVGDPIEPESKTVIDADGVSVGVMIVLPLLMVGFSYWSHRKTGLSRPLTIGMLAVAVSVLFLSAVGQFYIPALIALAVGSFQARKAELPARTAARLTRDDGGEDDDDEDDFDDDVIDVDSVEEVDEDEDEYEDDEDLEDEDEDDFEDEDDVEDFEDEDDVEDFEDEGEEDDDEDDAER